MGALDRLFGFIEECRGISQKTWDSYSVKQRKIYLKENPTSMYKPKVRNWFVKVVPRVFKKLLLIAKMSQPKDVRWRVDDTHSLDDYKKDKLYVTKGGSTVAVTYDKDIISVCGNRNDIYSGKDLLKQAVSKGGRKLDAYGSKLFFFYTHNKFRPISWTPFNIDYAPKDFNVSLEESEDSLHIIFYVYDSLYIPTQTYEQFISTVAPCLGENGYEQAKQLRDNLLQ